MNCVNKITTYSKQYDIYKFRNIIHNFYLRLKYDENSAMNKACSSSSLLSIHEGKNPTIIHKNESNVLLEGKNNSSSEAINDFSVHDSGFDDSSSKANKDSSSNDGGFGVSNFDINSYQF